MQKFINLEEERNELRDNYKPNKICYCNES